LTKPWFVESVELDDSDETVIVTVGLSPTAKLECPDCKKAMPGYDKRERRWRHLDTCQYTTILVADVPRGTCEKHGVRQIQVPWVEPGSQFTALFESRRRRPTRDLRETRRSPDSGSVGGARFAVHCVVRAYRLDWLKETSQSGVYDLRGGRSMES